MKARKPLVATLLLSTLALGATQLAAQPGPGYGPGYGHHMMGGWGGPGYGMMGGWAGDCPGYGAGGYGMGPGMMHGYGPRGYGMGPGTMWGYGPRSGPYPGNLTEEQRTKIDQIQQDFQRKQWTLMSQMHEAHAAGYAARDEAQARETYRKIAGLREQMFNNRLEAQREIDAVLGQGEQKTK